MNTTVLLVRVKNSVIPTKLCSLPPTVQVPVCSVVSGYCHGLDTVHVIVYSVVSGYNGVPVIAINNYEEVIKLNALPVHNVFEGSIHRAFFNITVVSGINNSN
jgi:hypothetical protein